jgi:hypothetical protein
MIYFTTKIRVSFVTRHMGVLKHCLVYVKDAAEEDTIVEPQ